MKRKLILINGEHAGKSGIKRRQQRFTGKDAAISLPQRRSAPFLEKLLDFFQLTNDYALFFPKITASSPSTDEGTARANKRTFARLPTTSLL
jgi:hypothetical protein